MNRKIGILLSFVYTAMEVLITFFLTPFIIKTLGDAEYGVYKLCESVTTYLLLLDLGVGQAIVRYIAKYRVNNQIEEIKQATGISTTIYAVIGLVTIFVGLFLVFLTPYIFGKGLSESEISLMQTLLLITSINAAITLGTTGFSNTIIAYERFSFFKVVLMFQLLVRGVVVFITLQMGMGSIGIVLTQLILTIICRLLMIYYVFFCLKIHPNFKNLNKGLFREILGFSGWIFIMMIATQFNKYLDQILLGIFVPTASVLIAVYSTGLQLEYYFEHAGYAINNVMLPGVVKMVESNASPEKLCDEMIRIGRYVLIFLSLIYLSFLVCGKELIILWVGEDYKDAYMVALLLMSVSIITMTQSIGDNILSAMRELKEWALLNLLVIVINVVISVILIQWQPVLGVLIGTFISMLLCGVVVKNYLFVKKIHINLIYYYKGLLKKIWLCFFITLGWGLLINHYLPFSGWIRVIIVLFLMCVLYLLTLFLYGFTQNEKHYIKTIIFKVFKKRKN